FVWKQNYILVDEYFFFCCTWIVNSADKLPFTSPDDPLLKARMEDCRLRGGDPFDEVQLPDAVITLKQGVGRLIRDADDRGVLVICDNRLVMRPYGATFLASLPPAPRTRDIARAVRFLAIPSSR
ncbi:helicase C-terminal domain-containing protein, partial [Escherichia coli]|uniref:helicase C-terminal domain-containing protein n=1 Tax=Escherichia coli TaxID=562 RepID=UPI0025582773